MDLMCFCASGINVQPDPVKFVQMNNDYWPTPDFYSGPKKPQWQHLGYQLPEGCRLSSDPQECPEGSLIPDKKVNLCQICKEGSRPWTYTEWILTDRPGVFGLVKGAANITGILLIISLTIMVICSMSFVRRSGYFQASAHLSSMELINSLFNFFFSFSRCFTSPIYFTGFISFY